MQVRAVRVFIDVKNSSPQAAAVKRELEKLGKPYLESGCSRTSAPIAMVLSHMPLRGVEKTTLSLPDIRSWARIKIREAHTVTDDQRLAILEREMKTVDLSRAPHLRTLALAELARVKNSGETIRRLNRGVLVVVSFEGR